MKENRIHHYRIVKPFRFFLFVVISIMIIVFAGYTVIGAGNAEAAAGYQIVCRRRCQIGINLTKEQNAGADGAGHHTEHGD